MLGYCMGGLLEMGDTYALDFGGSTGCVGVSVRHIAMS